MLQYRLMWPFKKDRTDQNKTKIISRSLSVASDYIKDNGASPDMLLSIQP